MSATKRKIKQEGAEPEEPKVIRSIPTTKRKTKKEESETGESQVSGNMSTMERKVKQEETMPEESQDVKVKNQPAMTITIQSWATPIVGFVMLILGLLAGYYIRPLILAQSTNAASSAIISPPVAIPTADNSATQKQLMDSVVAKTRHFKGDANAPVTIIEFADFQCPYCGAFEPTLEQAVKEYGDKIR